MVGCATVDFPTVGWTWWTARRCAARGEPRVASRVDRVAAMVIGLLQAVGDYNEPAPTWLPVVGFLCLL